MPMSSIVECLRPARSEINNLVGTRGMLQLRGDLVPLVHLGDLLDIASTAGESSERVVIITDAGEGSRFGLVVDELCGHQQVVIKSIEESYGSVPGIAARRFWATAAWRSFSTSRSFPISRPSPVAGCDARGPRPQ